LRLCSKTNELALIDLDERRGRRVRLTEALPTIMPANSGVHSRQRAFTGAVATGTDIGGCPRNRRCRPRRSCGCAAQQRGVLLTGDAGNADAANLPCCCIRIGGHGLARYRAVISMELGPERRNPSQCSKEKTRLAMIAPPRRSPLCAGFYGPNVLESRSPRGPAASLSWRRPRCGGTPQSTSRTLPAVVAPVWAIG
jgi:hypothetical protein